MSEQDTAWRHPGIEEARTSSSSVGLNWFTGQAETFYDLQRRYTLNGDDDGGLGAGLLWLYHGTDVEPERQAEAAAMLADLPPNAMAVQTTMDLFGIAMHTPQIRDEGVCYGLDHLRSRIAQIRLAHDGGFPEEVIDAHGQPMGVATSLVEVDGDGREYMSLYLVNGVGQSFITRVPMTGPAKGQPSVVTADLDLTGDMATLERQAVNGDIHPYLVSLWQIWVTVIIDVQSLREAADEEIGEALTQMAAGEIAGFSINGMVVGDLGSLTKLLREAMGGDGQ